MWPFKKNDWVKVYESHGEWECYGLFNGSSFPEICTFTIWFSPIRKRYKLKTSGLNPYVHSKYELAKQALNTFRNYKP